MQEIAWASTLFFVALLAGGFILVINRSGVPGDYARIQGAAARVRSYLFWLLILAGAGLSFATLQPWPHGAEARSDGAEPGEPLVVTATASQWYWELSTDEIPVGRPITFAVTSTDVNHGFAIYDEDLRVVTQIQAMPGYVNELHHVFTRPGRYQVLCLEYCGLVHHDMMAELIVTAGGE